MHVHIQCFHGTAVELSKRFGSQPKHSWRYGSHLQLLSMLVLISNVEQLTASRLILRLSLSLEVCMPVPADCSTRCCLVDAHRGRTGCQAQADFIQPQFGAMVLSNSQREGTTWPSVLRYSSYVSCCIKLSVAASKLLVPGIGTTCQHTMYLRRLGGRA